MDCWKILQERWNQIKNWWYGEEECKYCKKKIS